MSGIANLENGFEASKMPNDARLALARADRARRENAGFSLEDFNSPGKIAVNPDWLKEVSGKWPGDESIEELLVAFDNIDKGDLRGDSEWRRMLTR